MDREGPVFTLGSPYRYQRVMIPFQSAPRTSVSPKAVCIHGCAKGDLERASVRAPPSPSTPRCVRSASATNFVEKESYVRRTAARRQLTCSPFESAFTDSPPWEELVRSCASRSPMLHSPCLILPLAIAPQADHRTPASSNWRLHWMLLASSKRARLSKEESSPCPNSMKVAVPSNVPLNPDR